MIARKINILLVEDDKNLSESLSRYLIHEGFGLTMAMSLMEARGHLKGEHDLLVLDWMLPDGQGIDLLKELLREGGRVPVILLTSRADLVDKVLGLELGACDYMTKPFEPRELSARIRAQLRKMGPSPISKDIIHFAGIEMNHLEREVCYQGQLIELSKMEYELLKTLLESPNRVFPREALLNKVWGYENYPTTRTVDNHIVQLRQKLDSSLIETVRGVGYRLRAGDGGGKG